MRHLQAAPNSVEQSPISQQFPPGATLSSWISVGQEKGVSPAVVVVVVVLATVVVSGGGATVVVSGLLHIAIKSTLPPSTTESTVQAKPGQHTSGSHSSPSFTHCGTEVVKAVLVVSGGASVVVGGGWHDKENVFGVCRHVESG